MALPHSRKVFTPCHDWSSPTIFSALIGTVLGFIAARFDGIIKHFAMMLATSKLLFHFSFYLWLSYFFANTIKLLTCLPGFLARERYTTIITRLSVSANNQGYTAVFLQLGVKLSRINIKPILPNIVSLTDFSWNYTSGKRPFLFGARCSANDVEFRQHEWGRQRVPRQCALDNVAPAFIIIITTKEISFVGEWMRDN